MPIKKKFLIINKCLFPFILLMLIVSCSSGKKGEESMFEPEASLKKANELAEKGYYENAREIFHEIEAKDASKKYAVIAKLRIADSYLEEGLYDEAAVEYESFLGVHPYHKYASYAQYKLAMTYFKRIQTVDISSSWARKAKEEFEKLQRHYPRNPYMDITESRIKACVRILAEYEFYVAHFYFKKGSYQAAVQRFNGLLKDYPDSKSESEALYYLGLSYKNLGQREEALHALHLLIDKFPTIELSNEARELIASFDSNK